MVQKIYADDRRLNVWYHEIPFKGSSKVQVQVNRSGTIRCDARSVGRE